MPQTPLTAATPYCSASQLLDVHDADQVADALATRNEPRPSRLAMLDATSRPGARLLRVLLGASGELESAAVAGRRYSPADLAAMTGAGAEYLRQLAAHLAFWRLCQVKQPGAANPDQVPGAKQALAELDRLRDGERVFAFDETAAAGLPGAADPATDPQRRATVVDRASRLFGNTGCSSRGW